MIADGGCCNSAGWAHPPCMDRWYRERARAHGTLRRAGVVDGAYVPKTVCCNAPFHWKGSLRRPPRDRSAAIEQQHVAHLVQRVTRREKRARERVREDSEDSE